MAIQFWSYDHKTSDCSQNPVNGARDCSVVCNIVTANTLLYLAQKVAIQKRIDSFAHRDWFHTCLIQLNDEIQVDLRRRRQSPFRPKDLL